MASVDAWAGFGEAVTVERGKMQHLSSMPASCLSFLDGKFGLFGHRGHGSVTLICPWLSQRDCFVLVEGCLLPETSYMNKITGTPPKRGKLGHVIFHVPI